MSVAAFNPNETDPESIVVNDGFQHALDLIHGDNANLFITGKAGTGKSTLLQMVRKDFKKRGLNVVTVAPTGIAALNVRGQTIHSFFKFPPKLLQVDKVHMAKFNRQLYSKIDVLIVDEISMVRSDVFQGINKFLQMNRGDHSPFGGVRVILFGDLFQLPPIVREREVADYLTQHLNGPYFFNTDAYKNADFKMIELEEVFRQKGDDDFIHVLNQARSGEIDVAGISKLNERVVKDKTLVDTKNIIYLTTTNARALHVNQVKLDRLPGEEKIYKASVTGSFDKDIFPTEEELKLKIGAQVMVLKNGASRELVNGSIGIVTKMTDESVTIDVNGSEYVIQESSWEKIHYTAKVADDDIDEEITGRFKQLPLKLAWAITIHKSQGKTFDAVYLDMGHGAFAHGQAYVALSRCRTLERLYLKHPLTPLDFIVDKEVAEFLQRQKA